MLSSLQVDSVFLSDSQHHHYCSESLSCWLDPNKFCDDITLASSILEDEPKIIPRLVSSETNSYLQPYMGSISATVYEHSLSMWIQCWQWGFFPRGKNWFYLNILWSKCSTGWIQEHTDRTLLKCSNRKTCIGLGLNVDARPTSFLWGRLRQSPSGGHLRHGPPPTHDAVVLWANGEQMGHLAWTGDLSTTLGGRSLIPSSFSVNSSCNSRDEIWVTGWFQLQIPNLPELNYFVTFSLSFFQESEVVDVTRDQQASKPNR